MSEQQANAPLEDVISAFQRSLARAQKKATELSRSDSAFLRGDQPLYEVDGLDIELAVGVNTFTPQTDEAFAEGISLDFDAAPETRSRISFRVKIRPIEIEDRQEEKVILANLNPSRQPSEPMQFRATLIRPDNANYRLTVALRCGAKAEFVDVITNELGQTDFSIDTKANQIIVDGITIIPLSDVDLGTQAYYVIWIEAVSTFDETPLRSRVFRAETGVKVDPSAGEIDFSHVKEPVPSPILELRRRLIELAEQYGNADAETIEGVVARVKYDFANDDLPVSQPQQGTEEGDGQ